MTCFTKLQEGLRPTAREVGEVRGQFTTIKSKEMKPMNIQVEVKKLEDQESAINVACPMEDEASWVFTCKDDHEEEITQFDGEIVKKMMINEISAFLSNVDNVKISPEGFDSEVHDDEPVTVMPKEFGGRKLESTTKDGSDLGDEDEKTKLEELMVIIIVEDDAEYTKKS